MSFSFCLFLLYSRYEAIVPGKPSLLVEYKNKFYSFASEQHLDKFMRYLTLRFFFIYTKLQMLYHHHYYLVKQQEQISLTLSRHLSLPTIVPGKSSRLPPMSKQNCRRYVLLGLQILAHPCEGVHRRTSLKSSSLLLQQCPACLVHLIWMVLEIEGRWPYNCCFMGCCFQDLFNITHSILGQFSSSFFSVSFVSIHVVHPYSRTDTTTDWKKSYFILSDRLDFHMIENLLISVHVLY